MSEPNTSAAPIGAASSSLNVVRKRATSAKQSNGQKRQTTISKSLLVPRNSTTSLGVSKKGLPAPSAAKTKGTVKPTADSNWVRAQFVSFQIVQKLDDSGARVDVEEAIAEELQKARCIHCNGLFSTRNVTHMREHLVNPKTCSFVQSTAYKDLGPAASHAFSARVQKSKHATTGMISSGARCIYSLHVFNINHSGVYFPFCDDPICLLVPSM